MEQNYKNDQAGFFIFTFSVDIIHSLSLYMLVQGSHSTAMFATHALRESNSHVYISCVRAYNIDDLFHTERIDPGQWMKVATCISASHLPKSRIILRLTVAFCDFTVPSLLKYTTG